VQLQCWGAHSGLSRTVYLLLARRDSKLTVVPHKFKGPRSGRRFTKLAASSEASTSKVFTCMINNTFFDVFFRAKISTLIIFNLELDSPHMVTRR
jgi:hypothetical protein